MRSITLYLYRHGESVDNTEDRLGGDSELTPTGRQQAENLGRFLQRKNQKVIFYSPLKRAVQTKEIIVPYLPYTDFKEIPVLREISYGSLERWTVKEVRERFPKNVAERKLDKYHWKLLDGESYADVEQRVRPFILDLIAEEGEYGILAHRAVNKVILYILKEFWGIYPRYTREQILSKEILHEDVLVISHDERDVFSPSP